jgi:hypothetical protein
VSYSENLRQLFKLQFAQDPNSLRYIKGDVAVSFQEVHDCPWDYLQRIIDNRAAALKQTQNVYAPRKKIIPIAAAALPRSRYATQTRRRP